MLSLPIWIVSFTLLYFDSRVRKEAYDLDLIAREINPGFVWLPAVQPSAFGYQMPAQFDPGRAYFQTSPLGLAGYRPLQKRTETEYKPRAEPEELRDKFQRAAEGLRGSDEIEGALSSEGATAAACTACGASLLPAASFCMNCGSVTG